MKPQPDSPNWHWERLGYHIERDGQRRTMRRQDRSPAFIDQQDGERGHDAEVRVARAERRLPHGAAECQAAHRDRYES